MIMHVVSLMWKMFFLGDVLMAIGCGCMCSFDVMAPPCGTSGQARPHLFLGGFGAAYS